MIDSSYPTMTDLFCGAGGSSLGAATAGAEVRIALNHWARAIETHNTNFPDTYHECTDISACDPRRYVSTTFLWASPECTNHTLAKGVKRERRGANGQRSFLEGYGPDPASERSRATMWDVVRFTEAHRYQFVVVENVVEARDWVPYPAWIQAMALLGYDHREVYLNSQFAHPTPQSRDRLYVVFWRKELRAPDLDFRPVAWCPACDKNVAAVQSWKRVTRPWGRYDRQYVYCCPACAFIVRPYYYAAANAIDWTLAAPIIGERKHPLKPKTLARIRAGLTKFAGQGPFTVNTNADLPRRNLHAVLAEPLPTQTTQVVPHLVNPPPFLVSLDNGGGNGEYVRVITDPCPTQTTRQVLGLVVETAYSQSGAGRAHPVSDPAPAQTARQTQALVTVPFITQEHGTGTVDALAEPLSTILAGGNHHGLAVPPPFLIDYHREGAQGLAEAFSTVTTLTRQGLVQPGAVPSVEECGFRVLRPQEIGRAMAFPEAYVVRGTSREQVKQYGNAVTPPVPALIIARCLAVLDGRSA